MKKHSLLLLILAAVLCIGLLSTGVCAAEDVWVGATNIGDGSYYVMNNNTGELTKSGASVNNFNAKYNAAAKTLTLKNLNYSGKGHLFNSDVWERAGIMVPGGTHIKVIDFCGIEMKGCTDVTGSVYGMLVLGPVTIEGNSGSGSETFVVQMDKGGDQIGINGNNRNVEVKNINLTVSCDDCSKDAILISCDDFIADSAVMNLWSGKSGVDNYGIMASGDVAVTDSYLDIMTGSGNGFVCGLTGDDIAMTDSNVSVAAGESITDSSEGIDCSLSISVDGGSLYAGSGKALRCSWGVYCNFGTSSLRNCECKCFSDSAGNESVAFYSYSDFTVEKSNLRICAGKAGKSSYGLEIRRGALKTADSSVFIRGDAAKNSIAVNFIETGSDSKADLINSDVIAFAKAGSETQKAYAVAPKCTYSGGYTVIAGSDGVKAKKVKIDSSAFVNPFVWVTATANTVNKFKDVNENSWYGMPVLWAVSRGITAGTGDGTTFSPALVCDRAQMVTFLWNLAGKPEPWSTIADTGFTDVQNGKYYTKAVLWAFDAGVTKGTSATTFEPLKQVSRAEVVTFLWNSCGQPKPQGISNPFKDLTANWYKNAVLWAYENGVTAGKTATLFAPQDLCTRAEIVSFLFRFDMIR